jgi:hypothetical protein
MTLLHHPTSLLTVGTVAGVVSDHADHPILMTRLNENSELLWLDEARFPFGHHRPSSSHCGKEPQNQPTLQVVTLVSPSLIADPPLIPPNNNSSF